MRKASPFVHNAPELVNMLLHPRVRATKPAKKQHQLSQSAKIYHFSGFFNRRIQLTPIIISLYIIMKLLFSVLFTALAINVMKAQNTVVTGSVKDETGKLLHYVFIDDNSYKNAELTDSLGNFTIAAHPDSKLLFKLDGYKDTVISAKAIAAGAPITLKPAPSQAVAADIQIETLPLAVPTSVSEDGKVTIVSKANVVGSRYLLDSFGHGFFTDASGKQVDNSNCLFNYEKMSGYLLLTLNKRTVMQAGRNQVKSFTIYDKTDRRLDFELVPAIEKSHFVQLLAGGSKYKIYKRIKTEFTPTEISHTASGDRGQDHDEFNDDFTYYVLDVPTGKVTEFSLRKKSIKQAFPNENDKVTTFLAENKNSIDDAYIGKLGAYLN